jgi:hypothetical protein
MDAIRLQTNSIWTSNKIALILLAIFVINLFPLECMSQDQNSSNLNFDVNDIIEMDLRYDWVIDIKVSEGDYLNYTGCKLNPLKKLIVSYHINPRLSDISGKFIKYEELWFYNGHAVGCRRLHDLNIPSSYQGAIRVIPSTATLKNSAPVGGAIVRLILDTGLCNCPLSAVFLPQDNFQDVINGLSRYNYYSSTNSDLSASRSLPVYIYSNPLGLVDTIYFSN